MRTRTYSVRIYEYKMFCSQTSQVQFFSNYFTKNILTAEVTQGPVAQWITRLTTDQKIPGSTPGRIERIFFLFV